MTLDIELLRGEQDDLDALAESMTTLLAESLTSEMLEQYCDLASHFDDLGERAGELSAQGKFGEAGTLFHVAGQGSLTAASALQEKIQLSITLDQEMIDLAADAVEQLNTAGSFYSGMYGTNLGLHSRNMQNHEESERYFNIAVENLQSLATHDETAEWLLRSAEAQLLLTRAQQASHRGNYSRAHLLLGQAIVLQEETADSIAEINRNDSSAFPGNITQMLNIDLTGFKYMYHTTAHLDHIARGNYESAAQEADAALEVMNEALEHATGSPGWLQVTVESEHLKSLANKERAAALVALERRNYSQAIAHYQRARASCSKAAQAVVKLKSPGGDKLQEILMHQSLSMDVAIRQVRSQAALAEELAQAKAEVAELRRSLATSLTNAGITVNANSTSDIAAKFDQSIQLTQHLESMSRVALNNFLEALRTKTELPSSTVEPIVSEGEALRDSTDSGSGFLAKVGSFSARTAAILSPFGSIADALVKLLPLWPA